MSRITGVAALGLLLVCGSWITGCDEEDDTPTAPVAYSVVGEWETDYPDTSQRDLIYITFRSDGSFSDGPTYPPSHEHGTYTVKRDTLTMVLQDDPPMTMITTVVFIDADNFVLTGTDTGNQMPLTRYVGP
jgi:hypothetical protein